ncbi:MAG TPA: GNAT family N-acetyltransferase [Polyangiaceae bacterium]|nr:GNAT family N-acetyltransferase [Polyangiaceae bacterium]
MTIEFGSLSGEDDLEALGGILGWSFGFEPSDARTWIEQGGVENVRVARRGGRLLGGLLEIPMGQWFGGRSVPVVGLAGVGVAPEARGERVALSLVQDTLRGVRRRGVFLSILYPSALKLYRAAGYELAGSRYRIGANLGDLPTARADLDVTPLEPGDTAAVEALYRTAASERPGYLDRGHYVWRRARESRKEKYRGFGVRGAGGLEGYVYLTQEKVEHGVELVVRDHVTATPAAARRLVAFFAAHRSTLKSLVLRGSALEPIVFAAPERVFNVTLAETWMLRVVDVAGALEARGYPPVDVAVDLELEDRGLPENAGRYRLEVSGGRARVTPGGAGSVALDERALAALYSGYMTPAALARSAKLEADPSALARLALLFAGPPPAMSDYF